MHTDADTGEGPAMLTGLNPAQREAVTHGDSPLLVIAGAGTGKTTTLAHRVAWLIAQGVPPGRILLLTFTRRAAGEMLRRVDAILRGPSRPLRRPSDVLWGGTFHAVAVRLLRLHGRSIGLDPSFTILDRSDAEDLLNLVRSDLGLARTDRRFPQKATCLDIYSRCVNAQQRLTGLLQTAFPWCVEHEDDLKRLFQGYVDRKAEQSVLDYDDLLLFWHGLLADPVAGDAVRARFDHVLVDEYQDTNRLQADLLRLLRPEGRGLTVVGDDAQSIYAFRAATVRNILDFPAEFPGAAVVTLEENYRSSRPLLEVTNRVIAGAAERHEKTLWSRRDAGEAPRLIVCEDEEEQTIDVVEGVLERREEGILLRDQAVLFRAAHHSLSLELELGRRNIPFHKYGGLRFLEMAHVKDLLAFLRLAENPRDAMAATRVLLLLPGIGPKRAAELSRALAEANGDLVVWRNTRPPQAAATRWPGLVQLLAELGAPEPPPLSVQLHVVRDFYSPLLELAHDHPEARLQDLCQLEQLSSRYPDRARFLAELTLDPPSYTGELAGPPALDEDYLILSTMHSAKGLEWKAVTVIHAADGNIPSDMATGSPEEIEEERRLFYVALTRARDSLTVYVPLRYYTHPRTGRDTHGYAQPSRFLGPEVRGWFREESLGRAPAADPEATSPASTTVEDIRRSLGALWD